MILHDSIRYYPVFLDLRDRPVLVIGGGRVALRKARGALEAGARVTVVAPRWKPEFESLPVTLRRRPFRIADVRDTFLVFAATDRREVNRRAALAAKERGILANVADAPGECDFLVPARVRYGSVQLAISTGGRSPALAAELRRRLKSLSILEETMPRKKTRKTFRAAKEVRAIARERIGTVPSARPIAEKSRRAKPKHKKPLEAEDE